MDKEFLDTFMKEFPLTSSNNINHKNVKIFSFNKIIIIIFFLFLILLIIIFIYLLYWLLCSNYLILYKKYIKKSNNETLSIIDAIKLLLYLRVHT